LHLDRLGMRRLVVIIIMLYVNILAHGQEQIKFCLTDGELIGRKWTAANAVYVESQYSDSVCSVKVFTSEDKTLRRTLRNKALYVMIHDTLYINCSRAIKDEMRIYATVTKLTNDKMFFVIPSDQLNNNASVVAAGVMGGLIGGAIAGAIAGTKKGQAGVSCLWDMATETVTILSPKNMKSILKVDKELFRQYKEENQSRQASPSVILEYLHLLYS